jgi:hypothetical protein
VGLEPDFHAVNENPPNGAAPPNPRASIVEESQFAPPQRQSPLFTAAPPPQREAPAPSRQPLDPWQPGLNDNASMPASAVQSRVAVAPPPPVVAMMAAPVVEEVMSQVVATDPEESGPVPPADEGETDLEPSPRRWGRIVFWVVAAIVVVLIVTIIRHNSPGQTPGSLTPQTVKSGSGTTSPTATVAVSSSVLNTFTTTTRSLDAANVTISRALANPSSLTVAQVGQAVSPYITALENFDFTLHITAWPQSMQVPSEDLWLRNQALVSFVQSISSESPAALPSWFSQLRSLGSRAETADNLVRKDIGLGTTTSYP